MPKQSQLLISTWRYHAIMINLMMVLLTLLCLSGCAGSSSSEQTTITILHTNDTHSHLESFVPFGEPEQGGAARRKTLIESIRDEVGHDQVLLVDAGDFFQGTPFYNAWQGSADIMALNQLGYDVVTLGNHEFDLGPIELSRAISGVTIDIAGTSYPTEPLLIPIVSTNLDYSAEPALSGKIQRSIIVEKNGEKIGILGVITPLLPDISSCGSTIAVDSYLPSIQAEIDRLIAQGVNKIILLSHAGYNVDITMVPQLSGVDVVVCSHDHPLMLPESAYRDGAPLQYLTAKVIADYPSVSSDRQGNTVLLVGAYEWGRLLGRIDVTFDPEGHIIDWAGEPIAIGAEIEPDSELAAKIARYKEPITAFSSIIIGAVGMYFDGDHNPGIRSQEMPIGNLVSDVMLKAGATYDTAVAAIVNSGSIRASLPLNLNFTTELPPYSVTFGDAMSVLPHGNTITTIDVTGYELVAALDNGLTWAYDYETMTIRSSGAFPQVSGLMLTYCNDTVSDMHDQINPPATCATALIDGGVVTSLQVAGSAVNLESVYRIATNKFLASGGDYYLALRQACNRPEGYCVDSGILALDAMVEEFNAAEPVIRIIEDRIVAE
ncbi:MAG: bifunctional metallophosphatase/5'-nucleotidase [Thermodesulfobacteriota bacterium]|nr:bifunctional metallophosphatase/5'-nucleotidase [Thermodesulfobacteriota bacterium]